MLTKKYFYVKLITLFSLCLYNSIKCQQEYVRCSDGFKATDYGYCPTIMSCPDPLVRTNLYTCAYDRSFATISKCKTGLECWHGECVTKEEEIMTSCPTHISCPSKTYTVKCPDNSCVEYKKDCPKYYDCPTFNPIRCGNGDCRKSLSDCPSLVHCPDTFPVMCNDGSCRSIKSQCAVPRNLTACADNTMTRCSDGTCTTSKLLCPTLTTCPQGYEKCWDGNCRVKGQCFKNEDNEVIKGVTCGVEEVLCQFDYTCASDISSCPTGIICPIDRPVKCWDNSCRDSIENCPAYQNCPSGLIECPDGSCGLKTCGTHITCSADAPYRCFDNTCRRNPEDCPAQPSCPSETPILCWDGRCLEERGECLAPSKCSDGDSRVKCPNGLCAKSSSSCKEEFECPSEFVKCKDGTCRKKLAFCPSELCPVNLPVKCKNGLCVSDEKYCDKDNGCPFNLPVKCKDGSCAASNGACPKVGDCPNADERRCEDGSCLPKKQVCPSQMGCPQDTPYRCANGECINPKKNSCSIPICDSTIPIKCFDGTCVLTSNYCPIERRSDKTTGNVICADGTQAHTYDECKPLVKCEEGSVRCDDGTCRSTAKECPTGKTCPNGEVRCENGSCAKDKNSCPADNGCTVENQHKCPNSGLCVNNTDLCATIEKSFDQPNGCPKEKPIKCPLKLSCVADEAECLELESSCPTGSVMCEDGYCTEDLTECDDHIGNCGDGKGAEDKKVQCLSEPDWCAKTLGDCYNSINCKVDNPFRCQNGECRRYPSNKAGTGGCDIGISCPNYKPFLCADGSCAEKPYFCKSHTACSGDKKVLCPDKTCAETEEECKKNHQKCPSKNPILCPNGNCGASIYDCNESKCPSWSPYYCILGYCANNPRDCQKILYDPATYQKNVGSVCKSTEYICIDGTCREKPEECPIYSGCVSSEAPYKCLDGGCAKDKDSCTKKNDPKEFDCPNDSKLCEDGICRKNCTLVVFNGCPNSAPLLCPNGRCVSEPIECVGESACDSTEKPFRCIDGTCGATLADCKIPFREVGATNVAISIYPKMEVVADLLIGPNSLLSGKVAIPSGTLVNARDGSAAETQVNFRSISRNVLVDTYTTYDITRDDDLKLVFPYADPDSNHVLSYQYAVLSSAMEVTLKNKETTKFAGSILLTLLFDFPYLHKNLEKTNLYEEENEADYQKTQRYSTLPLSFKEDVCLAKLNLETKKWECNKLNFNVEGKTNLQLTGEVKEEGIYAVVLELRRNTNKLYINENWFLAHLKLLTFIFLGILLLIGICIYIFGRIYRYRQKYKGTKEIYKGFELEINDLQDKSVTGRQGQTYGDVKEGIIYTDNIAFKTQVDGEARKKNTQLEKIFDAYTKKLRLLERNNALLKGQYDSIKNEYDRLNNYKATLKEGDQVKIQVNIHDPNENQNVGAINDDEDE